MRSSRVCSPGAVRDGAEGNKGLTQLPGAVESPDGGNHRTRGGLMALGVRASVAFLLAVVLICPSFAAEDRPPQPEPRDEAWRILHEGLNEKRASKRTEAVQALSLLAGDRRAATFALRAL